MVAVKDCFFFLCSGLFFQTLLFVVAVVVIFEMALVYSIQKEKQPFEMS